MTLDTIVPYLPHLQACLNATAAVLLLAGYHFIKVKNLSAHKKCMTATLITSGTFMASYLTYHFNAGFHPFTGEGMIRYFYFSILASHVILAICLIPMVIITATFALQGNIKKHPRIARWTLPIWLYVSVTGVIIYLFAFHIYPS